VSSAPTPQDSALAPEHLFLHSALIAPAKSPEVLASLLEVPTTLLCFDLEDGLAPELRVRGRELVQDALRSRSADGRTLLVRVNEIGSRDGLRDLISLVGDDALPLDGYLLPKVEHPRDVEIARQALAERHGTAQMWALIETPLGIEKAFEICRSGAVAGVVLGAADLAARNHARRSWENLLYARSRLVDAARSCGVTVIDSPFFDLDDPVGLASEAMASYRLGFHGKGAVHPRQLETIERSFQPTDSEVAEAKEVLRTSRDGGAVRMGGRMVGPPLIQEAATIAGQASRHRQQDN
jgi:(S)-citramalyl-CoA lyase